MCYCVWIPSFCSVLQVLPGCDRQLPVVTWFHTFLSPPSSAYSGLGNHRPPGWRQPVKLRAGHPAQSIPLHFLSICSGLFINNYCLAELQCAHWLGQGERLGDLSPPLGWLGSHRYIIRQHWCHYSWFMSVPLCRKIVTPKSIKELVLCSCTHQQWHIPGRTWYCDVFTINLVQLFNSHSSQ